MQPAPSRRCHDCSGIIYKFKRTPSNTSAHEDSSKYLLHVSSLEGTFIHVSYSLLNQSQVSNGSSFFLPLPGIENPRKPRKIRLSRGISLEQLVPPRDTVTTAASLPEASLANPDYFVI